MTIRIGLLLAAFLMTTGCVEYYNQICTDIELTDVANLAGIKSVHLYDAENLEAVPTEFKVEHLSKGLYKIGEEEFRTCRINGRTLAEFKLRNGNFASKELLTGPDGQYSESTLLVGKSELEKLGIEYKIETRPAQFYVPKFLKETPLIKKFMQEREQDAKVIVIHNKSKIENQKLVRAFRPLYIGFSYQ